MISTIIRKIRKFLKRRSLLKRKHYIFFIDAESNQIVFHDEVTMNDLLKKKFTYNFAGKDYQIYTVDNRTYSNYHFFVLGDTREYRPVLDEKSRETIVSARLMNAVLKEEITTKTLLRGDKDKDKRLMLIVFMILALTILIAYMYMRMNVMLEILQRINDTIHALMIGGEQNGQQLLNVTIS